MKCHPLNLHYSNKPISLGGMGLQGPMNKEHIKEFGGRCASEVSRGRLSSGASGSSLHGSASLRPKRLILLDENRAHIKGVMQPHAS